MFKILINYNPYLSTGCPKKLYKLNRFIIPFYQLQTDLKTPLIVGKIEFEGGLVSSTLYPV